MSLAVPAGLGFRVQSIGLSQTRRPRAVNSAREMTSGGFASEEDTGLAPSVTHRLGEGVIFRGAGGEEKKTRTRDAEMKCFGQVEYSLQTAQCSGMLQVEFDNEFVQETSIARNACRSPASACYNPLLMQNIPTWVGGVDVSNAWWSSKVHVITIHHDRCRRFRRRYARAVNEIPQAAYWPQ